MTVQAELDFSAAAAGDRFEIRWKSKTLTGGTERGTLLYVVVGAQNSDGQQLLTDYIANINTDSSSKELTLKQTDGTSRSIPWQVFKWV